jgi:hypothetical protein
VNGRGCKLLSGHQCFLEFLNRFGLVRRAVPVSQCLPADLPTEWGIKDFTKILDITDMTPVGFEPTPLRTGALSQRLRPLGQSVLNDIEKNDSNILKQGCLTVQSFGHR